MEVKGQLHDRHFIPEERAYNVLWSQSRSERCRERKSLAVPEIGSWAFLQLGVCGNAVLI
jgi:hypothetical protein